MTWPWGIPGLLDSISGDSYSTRVRIKSGGKMLVVGDGFDSILTVLLQHDVNLILVVLLMT